MKKEIKKPLPKNVKNTNNKNLAKRLLIGLFLFWTIGSIVAFSCLVWLVSDKHKNNTAMVTASADNGGLYTSVQMDGFVGAVLNDGYINVLNSTLTLTMSAPVGGFAFSSDTDDVLYMYEDIGQWKPIDVSFYDASSNTYFTAFTLEFMITNNSYTLLDSSYRLVEIFYSQYDVNKTLSCAMRYNNGDNNVWVTLHLRSEENYDFILAKSGSVVVNYDEAYVNSLRGQINDLNYQITQLNNQITTLRIDLEASESLRQSEVAELNNEITTLRNAILNLETIISQKNDEIDGLEADIRDLIAGKNKIYQNGYDTGFADGATAGAADAYNQGYAAAVADGHGGGNFRSMIGALIDVPVNAITSLLDWNLLGINLKEFFFSILSVIVVVKIAMLFMR